MKKISENRPFLNNSNGNAEISFAVATRNTRLWDSWSQNKNCPRTRFPVSFPESETESAFSISSTQTTQGETLSINWRASFIFFSLSPTHLSYTVPISKRKRGNSHSLATIFADNDLPHPGTPARRMPFGVVRSRCCKSSSEAKNMLFFELSHSFSASNPDTVKLRSTLTIWMLDTAE